MQKLNELVPVNPGNIGGVTVSLVSAKKLHEFLGVGRDFTTWIKGRISQYGFTAGVDFTVVENLSAPVSGSAKYRQQIAHDYLITIDMGKELAMVERNEKGREVRRYFINCERQAKAAANIPQTLPEALRLAADLAEKASELENRLVAAAPKLISLIAWRRSVRDFHSKLCQSRRAWPHQIIRLDEATGDSHQWWPAPQPAYAALYR